MARYEDIQTERRMIGRRAETTSLLFVSSADAEESAKTPRTVVFGNGAFGGYHTFGPIVKEFMRAARKADVPIEAVMCRDSGREDPYGVMAQCRRLQRVVEYVTDQRQRPVELVGSSLSWPAAVALGHVLPDRIASLHAFTPIGHRGTAEPVSLELLAGAAIAEARYVDAKTILRNPRCAASLGATAVNRMFSSQGLAEVMRVSNADATRAAVEWRQRYAKPLGMLLATHDALFLPPNEVQEELRSSGADIRFINSTHLGAVLDHRHGQDLFQLVARIKQDEPTVASNSLQPEVF